MQNSVAVCSVITRDYVAPALATFDSLKAFHPKWDFHVLVVDQAAHPDTPAAFADHARLLPHAPEWISDFDRLSLYYDAFELVNALRAPVVRHLLFEQKYQTVFYVDSDLLFTGALTLALKALSRKSVFLVPHALEPYPADGGRPNDLSLLQWGLFNSGFLGFSRTEAARHLLAMLCDRARDLCFFEPPYLHAGQELLDLLPLWFPDDVHISRDEGYNLGFWNLHAHRQAMPVLYHLSGYHAAEPRRFTTFASRVSFETSPALRYLTETYRLLLAQHTEEKSFGYGLAIHDGITLNKWHRRYYYREGSIVENVPGWFTELVREKGWNAFFNEYEYQAAKGPK